MVELLVSMSIIGLLVALLLPAVQSSRESSRAIDCRNRLKQMGVALHSIEATDRVFPSYQLRDRLEPYMDQVNLPVYLRCPSDPRSSDAEDSVSYLMNHGTRVRLNTRNGFYKRQLVIPTQELHASEITDGLSNTAAFSERLIGEHGLWLTESELKSDPLRYAWYANRLHTIDEAGEAAMALDCESPATPYPWAFDPGKMESVGYDHRLPPNSRACAMGPPPLDGDFFYAFSSFVTATSLHPGTVHLLLADGSVRAVSENIDRNVWRALGTRAGNETISGEF